MYNMEEKETIPTVLLMEICLEIEIEIEIDTYI